MHHAAAAAANEHDFYSFYDAGNEYYVSDCLYVFYDASASAAAAGEYVFDSVHDANEYVFDSVHDADEYVSDADRNGNEYVFDSIHDGNEHVFLSIHDGDEHVCLCLCIFQSLQGPPRHGATQESWPRRILHLRNYRRGYRHCRRRCGRLLPGREVEQEEERPRN